MGSTTWVRVYATELGESNDTAEGRRSAARDLLFWYLLAAQQAFAAFVPDASVQIDDPESSYEVPEIDSREDASAWSKAEASNVLVLTRYAVETGENQLAWQLAWHMYAHYYSAGLLTEWAELLDLALRATEQLRAVLDSFRTLGGEEAQITVLVNLTSVIREMKQYREGIQYAEEAVRFSETVGTQYQKIGTLDALCELYVEAGRPAEALACGQAVLDAERHAAMHLYEANLLVNVGHAHRDLGDLTTGVEDYEAAMDLCAELGDRYHEVLALIGLAELRLRAGQYVESRAGAPRALDIFIDLNGEEADVARGLLAELNTRSAG